jgi:GNAT superfamily N-acetyltransferase
MSGPGTTTISAATAAKAAAFSIARSYVQYRACVPGETTPELTIVPGEDDSVWAVTCILVRAGFRRRRISYPLARAAIDFARRRGARALEGYSMITEPGSATRPSAGS